MTADRRPSSRKPRSPRAARAPRTSAAGRPGTGAHGRSRGEPAGQPPRGTASRHADRRGTGPSGGRARLERASALPLVILSRLPRWLLALLLAVILVAGLALSGIVGAVLLVLLAGFLGWLLALSWPALSAGGRVVRAVVVAIVLGAAVWQLATG